MANYTVNAAVCLCFTYANDIFYCKDNVNILSKQITRAQMVLTQHELFNKPNLHYHF